MTPGASICGQRSWRAASSLDGNAGRFTFSRWAFVQRRQTGHRVSVSWMGVSRERSALDRQASQMGTWGQRWRAHPRDGRNAAKWRSIAVEGTAEVWLEVDFRVGSLSSYDSTAAFDRIA